MHSLGPVVGANRQRMIPPVGGDTRAGVLRGERRQLVRWRAGQGPRKGVCMSIDGREGRTPTVPSVVAAHRSLPPVWTSPLLKGPSPDRGNTSC